MYRFNVIKLLSKKKSVKFQIKLPQRIGLLLLLLLIL